MPLRGRVGELESLQIPVRRITYPTITLNHNPARDMVELLRVDEAKSVNQTLSG